MIEDASIQFKDLFIQPDENTLRQGPTATFWREAIEGLCRKHGAARVLDFLTKKLRQNEGSQTESSKLGM